MKRRQAIIGAATVVGAGLLAHVASAQTQITIMVFPGTPNLPLFAAQSNGFFVSAALCNTAKSARRCPFWVKSGRDGSNLQCPLYPQKRTSLSTVVMSALCQKRTYAAGPRDFAILKLDRRRPGSTSSARSRRP